MIFLYSIYYMLISYRLDQKSERQINIIRAFLKLLIISLKTDKLLLEHQVMETSTQNNDQDKQLNVLRFLEATNQQSYDHAHQYLAKYSYNLHQAINNYLQQRKKPKTKPKYSNLSKRSNVTISEIENFQQFKITPQQVYILERRLREKKAISNMHQFQLNNRNSTSLQRKQGFFHKAFSSCQKSFNCFSSIKRCFQRKLKILKKQQQKITYFNEIYLQDIRSGELSIEDHLIESYQLKNLQENHRQKIMQSEQIKPIFAMISPNRKIQSIQIFLRKKQLMRFLRQHFEIVFITLSQLKDIQLERRHQLRKISKCPIVIIYLKNFYQLQDVLARFQGQQVDKINQHTLKEVLTEVQNFAKKWKYLMQLENKLKNKISHTNNPTQPGYNNQFDGYQAFTQQMHQSQTPVSQNKQSLIKQQTEIYQQMLIQQKNRKKSIQLQKQRLQQLHQQLQIRHLSIPSQPQSTQNCIQFRFRCPLDGQQIVRRFLNDQKVDILYQYVDTNKDIQFQAEKIHKKFDLFTSYPPQSLMEKRESILKDVFDQQKETILIREI